MKDFSTSWVAVVVKPGGPRYVCVFVYVCTCVCVFFFTLCTTMHKGTKERRPNRNVSRDVCTLLSSGSLVIKGLVDVILFGGFL